MSRPSSRPADAGIAAAYDARAAEYLEVAGDIDQMDAADRALIARWRESTPGALLDAGCGPGHWTQFLHDGHRDVVGIDLSARFVASARGRFPHLPFLHQTFQDLPFADGSFGGILAWYSLIHTPPDDVPAVLGEFARTLVPGGSILVGFFDGVPREEFAHGVAPAHFWSAEALSTLAAEAGFVVTERERRDRQPAEVSRRPHGALVAVRQ